MHDPTRVASHFAADDQMPPDVADRVRLASAAQRLAGMSLALLSIANRMIDRNELSEARALIAASGTLSALANDKFREAAR